MLCPWSHGKFTVGLRLEPLAIGPIVLSGIALPPLKFPATARAKLSPSSFLLPLSKGEGREGSLTSPLAGRMVSSFMPSQDPSPPNALHS